MSDKEKTQEQLVEELQRLRRQVAELQENESKVNAILKEQIAERERTEEALAQERSLLHALLDNLPDHIYFKDAASRFIRVSKALANWFGLSDPAQAGGKTDFDFFTVEHAQPAYADEQAVMKTGQPLVGKEEKETWPDGRETWVSTTKLPLRDNQGHIIGTFGVSRDITELKQTEESLAAERTLLRTLMDNLPDYIYAKDAVSRFVLNNAAHLRLLGATTPGEAAGKTDLDFFPEELARQYYADEQEIIRSGQPLINREELVVDQTTHKRIWNLTSKVPLRDSTGSVVGLVGIGRDITERKLAEEALAHERDLLRALMDNLPDAIYFKDADSRFTRINKAQAERFDLNDPAQAVDKTDFDFFTAEHAQPAYDDEQEIIRSGQPLVGIEEKETWPDGRETWVSTTKVPLRDNRGHIIGTFGVSRDITELKRAEAKLERRAVQLQAAAEVARDATTTRDLDELLNRAVNLVRDRFGFYHAGIFLVDDQGEYAILTAATGEAGRAMLERGHKLRVGEVGIVGYVTGSGQSRIALDVGADAVHFRNPFLPETRSEMALPLKVGGRVIGALDVQSKEMSAFDEDDVRVLQTMADQLAVAIESARLLGELQASLREASILYQRYSQEAWSRAAAGDKPAGYVYDRARVVPMDQRLAPEVLARLQAGRIVTLEAEQNEDGSSRSTLIAPITLRGQVIGAIGFEGDAPDHSWSPEDLAMVEAVTNQVALALENARLLEEAQRRAAREQLARQITDKMRRAADMDSLMQISIREMAAALGTSSAFVQLSALPGSAVDGGDDRRSPTEQK